MERIDATKKLPEAFQKRMRAQLGGEYAEYLASFAKPPVRGLRVNTLKISVEELLSLSPYELISGEIIAEGFAFAGEAAGAGRHPYHAAGLYYMQEPSAALPITMATIAPGMRVLDLCAAPGGKSGAAAARLAGRGFLLANEMIASRAKTLASNLERLGVANAAVSSARPDAVAEALPEYFDMVLVDAPCSGEGMFRKDGAAAAEWSPEHVLACAERQALILESAAKCVRAGGAIVYSTCTFSKEENEGVIEGFLAAHPEFALEQMRRLYPHTCIGEGHFAARMVKTGGGFREQGALSLPPCRDKAFAAFIADAFAAPPEGEARLLPDGRCVILREPLPEGLSRLRVLTSGVLAGEAIRGRFEPAHALFMAAHGGEYSRRLELGANSLELSRFLAGEAIACPESMRGYAAVCAGEHPIGFGKAVDGVMKNHLPKGLRVG